MDKKEILAKLGGIPESIYDSIVASFYTETKVRLVDLRKALEANDFLGASRCAHAIKGSAANLHLYEINAIAKSLEAALKANQTDQAKDLLSKLTTLIP